MGGSSDIPRMWVCRSDTAIEGRRIGGPASSRHQAVVASLCRSQWTYRRCGRHGDRAPSARDARSLEILRRPLNARMTDPALSSASPPRTHRQPFKTRLAAAKRQRRFAERARRGIATCTVEYDHQLVDLLVGWNYLREAEAGDRAAIAAALQNLINSLLTR
jgi:hypothetical protein